MEWNNSLQGLLVALGIGLLVGLVRENREDDPGPLLAGVRTHALVALLAAVAAGLGVWTLVAVLVVLGAMVIASYLRNADGSPGITSEVVVIVTAMLAALARFRPDLATALAVVTAALVYAKRPLQRLAREVISPREMKDALLLAAAALVILPFLPESPVDPWGVLVPHTIWRMVVLVMAVGMLGHIAIRMLGARWGLVLGGFFAGLVSSTATVVGFGQRVREHPAQRAASVAAALLANLASLLVFTAVIGAGSTALMRLVLAPVGAAALVLLLAGTVAWKRDRADVEPVREPEPRAFRLSHALMFAVIITAVLLFSTVLRHLFGDAGAVAAAMAAAIAETHSAAASLSQLVAVDGLDMRFARWGVVGVLATSMVSKSVMAFLSGGTRYGLGVAAGLLAALVAAVLAALSLPPPV